jgi:hypothetical protein
MQNVGAWRMLGECSTRCHLEMWSFGMPYLEDVPCMGRVHGNVEIGEDFATRVLQLEPENAAGYVLLSNTYDAGSNGHLCEEC